MSPPKDHFWFASWLEELGQGWRGSQTSLNDRELLEGAWRHQWRLKPPWERSCRIPFMGGKGKMTFVSCRKYTIGYLLHFVFTYHPWLLVRNCYAPNTQVSLSLHIVFHQWINESVWAPKSTCASTHQARINGKRKRHVDYSPLY